MFKVRCELVAFEADEQKFPCHFNYKIGDEIYFDGVYFTGRICPGLFPSMMPVKAVLICSFMPLLLLNYNQYSNLYQHARL